jgi:hypothetical protein
MPRFNVNVGAAWLQTEVVIASCRVTWRFSAITVEGHHTLRPTRIEVNRAVKKYFQLSRPAYLPRRGHKHGEHCDKNAHDRQCSAATAALFRQFPITA